MGRPVWIAFKQFNECRKVVCLEYNEKQSGRGLCGFYLGEITILTKEKAFYWIVNRE